ncbi:MAG TPA: hypothetical protein VM163_07475 [bacterium]|nr:hypothetical protein [bacterium]
MNDSMGARICLLSISLIFVASLAGGVGFDREAVSQTSKGIAEWRLMNEEDAEQPPVFVSSSLASRVKPGSRSVVVSGLSGFIDPPYYRWEDYKWQKWGKDRTVDMGDSLRRQRLFTSRFQLQQLEYRSPTRDLAIFQGQNRYYRRRTTFENRPSLAQTSQPRAFVQFRHDTTLIDQVRLMRLGDPGANRNWSKWVSQTYMPVQLMKLPPRIEIPQQINIPQTYYIHPLRVNYPTFRYYMPRTYYTPPPRIYIPPPPRIRTRY